MSLKGYEFLDDDNKKVVARFFFKSCGLYILEKITDEKLQRIKDYLEKNGEKILEIKEVK